MVSNTKEKRKTYLKRINQLETTFCLQLHKERNLSRTIVLLQQFPTECALFNSLTI